MEEGREKQLVVVIWTAVATVVAYMRGFVLYTEYVLWWPSSKSFSFLFGSPLTCLMITAILWLIHSSLLFVWSSIVCLSCTLPCAHSLPLRGWVVGGCREESEEVCVYYLIEKTNRQSILKEYDGKAHSIFLSFSTWPLQQLFKKY